MGILEMQLKHVGYELDMLVYTFDKLLLVEQLVGRSFQVGQVNVRLRRSPTLSMSRVLATRSGKPS
jgi:hypothetical protein